MQMYITQHIIIQIELLMIHLIMEPINHLIIVVIMRLIKVLIMVAQKLLIIPVISADIILLIMVVIELIIKQFFHHTILVSISLIKSKKEKMEYASNSFY